MQVEFISLTRQHEGIRDELRAAFEKVLSANAFSGGPFVQAFEKRFAAAHNAANCVAVNNGTSALHAALMALDIGSGYEVIVPSMTFFATAEAVSLCGATPVFVDCDPKYALINPALISQAVTARTKAIIPVHLYGQAAPMEEICTIAKKHKLFVIEDCAQAHLATYKNKSVGTWGDAGCFSFYPGKNLGALGEGGAVLTQNEGLAKKISAIRDHGAEKKYHHDIIGHNYRMEGFQGAFLDIKLSHLGTWTAARRRNAAIYSELLGNTSQITLPQNDPSSTHVYHLFVVRTDERDRLKDFLGENGIATGIHYPIPCHLQKAYSHLGHKKGDFPQSEDFANRGLSLPMFAELEVKEIEYVANKIMDFYK